MDITWYGQACFKVKGKQSSFVIDPFEPAVTGIKLPKLAADMVLVTHNHPDHNYTQGVLEGDPVIIAGPGEYEVKGITITGIATYHDEQQGAERGKNTVYHAIVDNLSIVHLGDIGHLLSKEQLAAIDKCDILMIPVGGVYTISADTATEIITQLEPSIVLPMHYKIDGLQYALEPLTTFLKAVGQESLQTQPKLTITRDKLPLEPEVIIVEKQ